jgi:uncharacterized protein with HEPN domain
MPVDERDAGYLWDMLDAARTVHGFVAGVTYHQYLQDRKLQLAVERSLEIVGEAARHVSEDYRQAHPEIPWRGIIGLRYVLAHKYGEIRHDQIWLVVTIRIPALIALLEPLVPPLPPEAEG